MRGVLVPIVTLAALTCATATAARPSLSILPSSVRAGGTVVISGSADGCRIGNTVYVISRAFQATHEFAGVPAVLAKVRRGGRFNATTRIPRSRRPGRYGVTARCGGGNLGVIAHVRVTH